MRETSKRFLKDTAERVIATAAQTFVASVVVSSAWDVDWSKLAGVVVLSATLSLAKCIAVKPSGDPGSASAVKL